VHRHYEITQTIGSRFFQYYVGRQKSGPEPQHHPLHHEDHVLPFGYWIDRAEWVPIVHVHSESREDQREDQRHDPFKPREDPPVRDFQDYADYSGRTHDLYRSACNYCHTTFAIGDMFVRNQKLMARHVPVGLDVSVPDYLRSVSPEFLGNDQEGKLTDDDIGYILTTFRNFDASEHAVTLGVSCEACHLGAREHAEGKRTKPRFFPQAPELAVRSTAETLNTGRTHDNVNWACGRCHAGERPYFAAGMSTWNSTEYSDAMKGSCYSQLTCIKCHNPHETLGTGWSKTALEDDAICLSCHQDLEPEPARLAHTHHSLDSDGSRCMNCHMPRLNEGLQEVVRTHTIFSPTNAAMLQANQPNACNMCHVAESRDWTLAKLQDWYGQTYSDLSPLSAEGRKQSAALQWLHGDNEAVRLVAADCLTRAKADWAINDLLNALDDPYLLNRQFARIGLERMFDTKLGDSGYRFYMTPQERREPIAKLREKLAPAGQGEQAGDLPQDK
jgi:predicted CXXCH cytochrome family protein